MSLTIDTSFYDSFKAGLEHLLQQKGSKLSSAVRNESQTGEFAYFDRLESTEAQKITTRHGDTVLADIQHDRRRVQAEPYDWAELIDQNDQLRTLSDPAGPYAQAAAFSLMRKMDDAIIEAATGDAQAGRSGATTVSFPAAQQVAFDYVESGAAAASDLTIPKLRVTKRILLENEVSAEDGDMFISCSPTQLHSLLTTTEVTSSDFNTVRALVNGELDTFMGFKFIISNRLAVDGSGYRRVLAWAKSGLLLSQQQGITVDIGPRRDKRNSVQVYARADFGAVRMEEGKVVEIKCDEATIN